MRGESPLAVWPMSTGSSVAVPGCWQQPPVCCAVLLLLCCVEAVVYLCVVIVVNLVIWRSYFVQVLPGVAIHQVLSDRDDCAGMAGVLQAGICTMPSAAVSHTSPFTFRHQHAPHWYEKAVAAAKQHHCSC